MIENVLPQLLILALIAGVLTEAIKQIGDTFGPAWWDPRRQPILILAPLVIGALAGGLLSWGVPWFRVFGLPAPAMAVVGLVCGGFSGQVYEAIHNQVVQRLAKAADPPPSGTVL
jgi:drug/metabolite transporter (DMT)-like permease